MAQRRARVSVRQPLQQPPRRRLVRALQRHRARYARALHHRAVQLHTYVIITLYSATVRAMPAPSTTARYNCTRTSSSLYIAPPCALCPRPPPPRGTTAHRHRARYARALHHRAVQLHTYVIITLYSATVRAMPAPSTTARYNCTRTSSSLYIAPPCALCPRPPPPRGTTAHRHRARYARALHHRAVQLHTYVIITLYSATVRAMPAPSTTARYNCTRTSSSLYIAPPCALCPRPPPPRGTTAHRHRARYARALHHRAVQLHTYVIITLYSATVRAMPAPSTTARYNCTRTSSSLYIAPPCALCPRPPPPRGTTAHVRHHHSI
ncbi:unnamed protein product [Diatraea saccharalis]|uniref:Uncharacterized protein n=1 Tax=Diatraea saccharalis TaxID=40085 RepID=A0A9N9QWK9_9NEOP|nr:unnamed protein product [Diatraea saccharalis]